MPLLSPEMKEFKDKSDEDDYNDLMRKKQALMSIPGLNLAQIDEDASPCDGVNCPLAPEIEQAKARADVIKNESVKAKEANDLQKVKDD